jgi:hypothetical protein
MLDFIDPFYFILGLFIGLLYSYFKGTDPQIVYKYPTPDNAGKIVYQDKAGVCYKYRSEMIDCPVDKSLMTKQPVQT